MSKTLKRLLSMAVALVMVLSMVPTGVFHTHVHAADEPDLTYIFKAYDDLEDNGITDYRTNGGRTTATANTSSTTYNKITTEIVDSWRDQGLLTAAGSDDWRYLGYTGGRLDFISSTFNGYKFGTAKWISFELVNVPAAKYNAVFTSTYASAEVYLVPAETYNAIEAADENARVAAFAAAPTGYVGTYGTENTSSSTKTTELELDCSAGGSYILVLNGNSTESTSRLQTIEMYKQAEEHTHYFSLPTCTEPGKCTVEGCNEIGDPALGHDWILATVDAPKTCKTCGETEGISLARASITVDGVTTNYASLQEAVDAVQDGQTIAVVVAHTITESANKEGYEGYGLVIDTYKDFTILIQGKAPTFATEKGIYINTSSDIEGAEQKTVTFQNGAVKFAENCLEGIVAESDENATVKTEVILMRAFLTAEGEGSNAVVLKDADLRLRNTTSGNSSITNNAGGYNVWAEGESTVTVGTPATLKVTNGDGPNIYLADAEATAIVSSGTFSHEVPKAQLKAGYICTANDDGTYTVAACEHANVVTDAAEDATCTDTGLTEGSHCEDCGTVIAAQEEVPATGHTYTSVVTKAATHTDDGLMTYTCGCGDIYTEVIPAEGHDYIKGETTAPTCTEQGYTTYTCACGDSYDDDYVDATGVHSYNNYVSNGDATCVADGTETSKCDNCDATDTRTVEGSATGVHSYNNYVSNGDATCVADGTETSKCDNCDATDTRTVEGSATGVHSYNNYIYNNDATYNADGTETASCDYGCGKTDTRTKPGTQKTGAVAQIGTKLYGTLAEAIADADTGDTIVLLENIAVDAAMATDGKSLTIDLGGKTLSVAAPITVSAGDTLKITGEGSLAVNAAIAVDGTLDLYDIGYGVTGLVPGQSGNLAIGANGKVVFMAVWANQTAELLNNYRNTFFYGSAVGAKAQLGEKVYNLTAEGWVITGAVASIDREYNGQAYTETYASLADAIADAKAGETVYLLSYVAESVTIPAGVTVDMGTYGTSSITMAGGAVIHGGVMLAGAEGSDAYYITDNATFTFGAGSLTLASGDVVLGKDCRTDTEAQVLTIAEGATFQIPANVTWYVQPATTLVVNGAVSGEGVIAVSNVAQLMTAFATSVKNVKLLADIDLPAAGDGNLVYVPSSGRTLDLNGNTLGVPYKSAMFVGDTFTIKNGTIDGKGENYGLWIGCQYAAASNVTIDSVTVIGGINIYNASNVTLRNCTVSGGDYYAVWADNAVSGVVIESGSYTGAAAAVNAVETGDIATVGGTYSSDVSDYCQTGKHASLVGSVYTIHTIAEDAGTVTTEPTLNSTGVKTYKCSVCGKVLRTEVMDKLTGAVAQIGDVLYGTLEEAIAVGGEITLLKDVVVSDSVIITKDVVLDLNGKTISAASTLTNKPVIRVVANVTVKNGTVDGTTGINSYAFIVGQGTNAGALTIENGTYKGITSVISITKGTATINGGKFSTAHDGEGTDYGSTYLLNCMDSAYNAGEAGYAITGGEFVDFNPYNNAAEGAQTNFLADGQHASADANGVYTIHNCTVKVLDAVAPDCENTGLTAGEQCTECGEILVAQEVVDALGHTEAEAVEEGRVEATYNADGSYESVVYCSVCGEELSRETVVIPMLTGAEAQIGNVKYGTLAEAIAVGGEITLLKDVKLTATIIVDKDVVLDLNGKTITAAADVDPLFRVHANMTVKNGTVDARNGVAYAFIVGKLDGTAGNLTIESGNYYGEVSVASVTTGTLTVEGGYFEAIPYNGSYEFTLNCIDGRDAAIVVTGGSFYKFNPFDNAAEGEGTNILPDGLHASAEGDVYTIHTMANDGGKVTTEPTYNADGIKTYTCTACGEVLYTETVPMLTGAEAQIGNVKYGTLAEAIAVGGEITLLKDVKLTATIIVDKDVVLDLGGWTITAAADVDPLFRVHANMTVKNGTVDARNGVAYAFIVGKLDGTAGNLTIESGNYYGEVSVASVTTGTLTVEGGYFEAIPYNGSYEFTLNCIDGRDAAIVVTGGSFYKFNPFDNAAEGEGTNILPDDLHASAEGDVYTIHTLATETVVENNVDPDCVNTGSYDTVIYCTECGEELSRVTTTVDALGHTEAEAVVENNVDPTCTADGSYDNVVYCSVCGEELSRETVTVDALGHSYDAVVTDPTCTEQGYTTYTCSACGDSYVDNYVDATGHSFGEWYTVNAATCVADGLEQRDCANCDHYETNVLTASGHTDGEAVVENNVDPTCTVDGSYDTVTYCTVCGEETSRVTTVVDALGHSYDAVVTDPTCTEQGYTTYTCSACGDSYVDNYVDATGHSFGEWYTVNAATCVADGLEQRDCANCDHYETNVLPMTGHTYETEVTAPTCTEQGYTTYTCACGDSYVDDYVAATGIHSYTNYVYNNNATTTADGTETASCDHGCGATDTRVKVGSKLEAGNVAYIGDVYYETVTDAMIAAMGTGATVYLNKDHTETFVNVVPGVTLDLNGYTLTATIVYGLGEIKGDGLLAAPKDNVTLKGQTNYMPFWNGEGYIFASAGIIATETRFTGGNFAFQPKLNDSDITTLMGKGVANAGYTINVKISWIGSSGDRFTMDLEIPDSVVTGIYKNNYKSGIAVKLANASEINGLQYTVQYVSSTGAVFSGSPVDYQ